MPRRFLTRAQARAFYDRLGRGQDWQRWYEGGAIRELIGRGGFGRANAVFEVGCGTGALAEDLLARHLPESARYVGVDSSATMVGLSRKRLGRFGERAEVVQTDGSLTFALGDASFDRFVSTYVLDLLSPDDIRQVLAEAQRLLVPGGLLCLTSLTWGRSWASRALTWSWDRLHRLSPRLVGGCRPVRLADFVDEGPWVVECDEVVSAFGMASEVLVASRSTLRLMGESRSE